MFNSINFPLSLQLFLTLLSIWLRSFGHYFVYVTQEMKVAHHSALVSCHSSQDLAFWNWLPMKDIKWHSETTKKQLRFKFQGSFICHLKTGLYYDVQAVVPLYCTRKYFFWWNVDNDFRILTTWGKKQLCSLMVRQQILLYLLLNCIWVDVVFQYLVITDAE